MIEDVLFRLAVKCLLNNLLTLIYSTNTLQCMIRETIALVTSLESKSAVEQLTACEVQLGTGILASRVILYIYSSTYSIHFYHSHEVDAIPLIV